MSDWRSLSRLYTIQSSCLSLKARYDGWPSGSCQKSKLLQLWKSHPKSDLPGLLLWSETSWRTFFCPWVSSIFPGVSSFSLAEFCRNGLITHYFPDWLTDITFHSPDIARSSKPSHPSLWGHSSCRSAGSYWQNFPPSPDCWRRPHCSQHWSRRHRCHSSSGTCFASHSPSPSTPAAR